MHTRLIPARAGKTASHANKGIPTPAHPRSRGENVGVLLGGRAQFGSSPLARGKPGREGTHRVGARLIPARAGKTVITPDGNDAPKAHPRSRGENLIGSKSATFSSGSSPLARGKHHD